MSIWHSTDEELNMMPPTWHSVGSRDPNTLISSFSWPNPNFLQNWHSGWFYTDAASATWHAPTSLSFVFTKATTAAFHTPTFTLSMLAQFEGAGVFALALPALVFAQAGAAIPKFDFSCVETRFFLRKSPLRSNSPNANNEVVHRPRSLPSLQFDIRNI